MYTLNGWWFLSSGGAYPPVFTVGRHGGKAETQIPTTPNSRRGSGHKQYTKC